MADIVAEVKLQLDAGDAQLPKIAQNLGHTGANPVQVKHAYDAATTAHRGLTVPAVVTVRADRSFALEIRSPQTAALLRRAAAISKGSGTAGNGPVGRITRAQLRDVAQVKLADLNTDDLDAAERIVAGTARSMGLVVDDD